MALGSSAAPEWRVAGILSSGVVGQACGVGFYANAATIVPWLEDSSGRDRQPPLGLGVASIPPGFYATAFARTPAAPCERAGTGLTSQPVAQAMTRLLALVLPPLALLACSKAPASLGGDGHPQIAINVDAVGYHPAESHAKGGEQVHLVFTRTSEDGCGTEVVIPSANVKRELPLNKPVSIDVTMPKTGKLAFACGMDMMHGTVTAD